MEKLFTLLTALALCLSLAACGGPDKQPAIDAYNSASDAFNEVADVINENIDVCPDDLVDELNKLSEMLTTKADQLQNDDLSQEDLDSMTEWFGDVQTWADETMTELAG